MRIGDRAVEGRLGYIEEWWCEVEAWSETKSWSEVEV